MKKLSILIGIITICTISQIFAVEDNHPTVFIDEGICPFEYCKFGEWDVTQETDILSNPDSKSKKIGSLAKGTKIKAVIGIIKVDPPGKVEVLREYKSYKKGDIVWVYTYLGEGFFKVWFNGKMYEEDVYFLNHGVNGGYAGCVKKGTCWGKVISRPNSSWWIKLKNKEGLEGWSNKPQNFGVFRDQHATAEIIVSKDQLPYTIAQYEIDQSSKDKTSFKLLFSIQLCMKFSCYLKLKLIHNNLVVDQWEPNWQLPNKLKDSSSFNSQPITVKKTISGDTTSFVMSIPGDKTNHMEYKLKRFQLKNGKFSLLVIGQYLGFKEDDDKQYNLVVLENGKLTNRFSHTTHFNPGGWERIEIKDADNDGYLNMIATKFTDGQAFGEVSDSKNFHIYPTSKNIKIYATILSTAKSLEDILEVRNNLGKQYNCIKYNSLVLDTNDFNRLAPNLYILGDMFIRKEKALENLEYFKKCANISDAYIKRAK